MLRRSPYLTIPIILLLALSWLTVPTSSRAGTIQPVGIDRVGVNPPGSWRLTTGLRWESGRTLTAGTNDYNNLRVRPLLATYGLTKRFQIGGDLIYSSNSADRSSFPEESGLEGVNLKTKLRWNRNLATAFTLGYGLSDDVFPYGGDGLKVGLNFPAEFSMGPGTVIAELGYTINNGKARVPPTRVQWNDYFNYGLGYYYELTDRWRLTTEILGHGAVIDAPNAKDHLEFILEPEMILSKSTALKPSLSLGLADGSPSFALGVYYTYKIGGLESRRVRINEEDIGSDNFGSITASNKPPEETPPRAKKRQRQKPLVLPGELQPQAPSDTPESRKTKPDTPQRNPKKAQKLARRGRKAFEDDGNLDQAISYFQRAVKYDPKNVEILSNLGSLLYRDGQYKKARDYYRRALEVDPKDQFSHLFLGITYVKLEQYKKARKHLKTARSINPMNQSARRAQQWLQKIKNKTS